MTWKSWVWRAGMFALLITAGWKIYHRVAPDIHLDQLQSYSPAIAPLVISVLLIAIANILHAILWRRIAVDLGSPAPNARATLHIYFVSSLSKYLMPLGQVAGLAVVSARFGMAAGRAAASAAIGQLVFLTTGLLFMGVTMPGVGKALKWPIHPAVVGLIIAVAAIAGVWLVIGSGAGSRARHAILARMKGRMAERLANAFSMLDQARPRDAMMWAAGYLASWLIVGAGFALFVSAFTPIRGSQVLFACGIAAGSFVAGYISPVMAGLGVRELAMGLLLTILLNNPTLATLIAVSSRLWFMSGELLPLLLIPLSGTAHVTPAAPAPAPATSAPATPRFGAVL